MLRCKVGFTEKQCASALKNKTIVECTLFSGLLKVPNLSLCVISVEVYTLGRFYNKMFPFTISKWTELYLLLSELYDVSRDVIFQESYLFIRKDNIFSGKI